MRGVSIILRRLVGGGKGRPSSLRGGSSVGDAVMVSSLATISYSYASQKPFDLPQLFSCYSTVSPISLSHAHSSFCLNFYHNFSSSFSSSSSGSPNVVLIESEEQFKNVLQKVQDESLPAVFYFTAVWCGPCRLLSPVIGKLSEKYPHITTYKIDIDQDGLADTLSKLNIHSVPTLHFFQNGKKASEVIGADVQRLNDTMEKLYK